MAIKALVVITVHTLLESSLSFMTQMGMKWVVLTCGLWYRVIPYHARYGIRSIPCPHPENLHQGPRPWQEVLACSNPELQSMS